MMFGGNPWLEETESNLELEETLRKILSTEEGPNDFSLVGLAIQRMNEFRALRDMYVELKERTQGRNGF